MSDLSYKDHCVITRHSGGFDKYDQPIGAVEIYDGECDFQPGGQTSLSNTSHNDVVYLPGHVMVQSNDIIRVTNMFGRVREGVVKLVNDLPLDLMGNCVTEIEIKQSAEKE